jgi:prevent-host-death family protein
MDKLREFEHVALAQGRRRLGALVKHASEDQEWIVLTRRGRPAAVLVSTDDAEMIVGLEDLIDAKAVRDYLARGDAGETITLEELQAELGLADDE